MPARILAALVAVLFWLAGPAQAASNNILFLLADDMGVDVTSFYRPSVRTESTPAPPTLPNLRDLAAGGVTFTRMWTTPWCSPTRAGVITGRYGFRHGMGVPIDQSDPPFSVVLPLSESTLPEIIKDSPRGYVMRHIGKWHLNDTTDDPLKQGWPSYTGPHPGAGGPASDGTGDPNYSNWRKYTGTAPSTVTSAMTTKYATTDQVDEAISTIRSANTAGKPYFIWLAFNAPHSPFHKPPNALHSRDGLPATGGDIRDYYEATIEALDTEIGRLLANVDLATTTVIFMGDNGTPTNIAIAPYEATHSKGTIYQQGMHVPFVVAGQAVVNPGRYVTALANCVDVFPTILELAGFNPATVTPSIKRDGVSLLPYLQNKAHPNPRRWAYGEFFKNAYNDRWERVIRNVDFALIEKNGGGREFYNITNDPLQTSDILARTRTAYEQANLDELDGELDALLATR